MNGPWWAAHLFVVLLAIILACVIVWWVKYGDMLLFKLLVGGFGAVAFFMFMVVLGNFAFTGEFTFPEGPEGYCTQ